MLLLRGGLRICIQMSNQARHIGVVCEGLEAEFVFQRDGEGED